MFVGVAFALCSGLRVNSSFEIILLKKKELVVIIVFSLCSLCVRLCLSGFHDMGLSLGHLLSKYALTV